MDRAVFFQLCDDIVEASGATPGMLELVELCLRGRLTLLVSDGGLMEEVCSYSVPLKRCNLDQAQRWIRRKKGWYAGWLAQWQHLRNQERADDGQVEVGAVSRG